MNHLYKSFIFYFLCLRIEKYRMELENEFKIIEYTYRFLFHSPFYENVPVDCLYKHYLFLQEYISRIWKRTDER